MAFFEYAEWTITSRWPAGALWCWTPVWECPLTASTFAHASFYSSSAAASSTAGGELYFESQVALWLCYARLKQTYIHWFTRRFLFFMPSPASLCCVYLRWHTLVVINTLRVSLQDMLLLACTHPENRTLLTTMPEWPEWLLEVLISNYEVSYNTIIECFCEVYNISEGDLFSTYKCKMLRWSSIVVLFLHGYNFLITLAVVLMLLRNVGKWTDDIFICRLNPLKETINLRRLRRLRILYTVFSLSCWSTLCAWKMVGRLANNFGISVSSSWPFVMHGIVVGGWLFSACKLMWCWG